jgi:peptidoglycan/LPS O-acetylase OafA/YrhL
VRGRARYSDRVTTRVRTVLIIVAISAAVWAIPSGRGSADAVGNALSAIILAAMVVFGVRIYRETRGRVETLGDAHRALLYAGLGCFVVAMAARPSLTNTGPGTLLFIVLIAMPLVMLWAVWQRWREVG